MHLRFSEDFPKEILVNKYFGLGFFKKRNLYKVKKEMYVMTTTHHHIVAFLQKLAWVSSQRTCQGSELQLPKACVF